MTDRKPAGTPILSTGLHPSAIDYVRYPQVVDEATMTARIAAAEAGMRDAGFEIVPCYVPADPDEAEAVLRERLSAGPFEVAMIGAGVRMAPELTPLFERMVNTLIELSPGIRLCFNTSPESTVDALGRWVTPRPRS